MKGKVLVVAGPTASGKTSLGVQLAKALDGEIVSADSMQVYRGMEVATAQPTAEEMQGIPHHLAERFRSLSAEPVFISTLLSTTRNSLTALLPQNVKN